jgi:hypothetical protein
MICYYDNLQRKEMSTMYQPRQRGMRWNGMVSDLETRCVARVGGLLPVRRHRAVLVTQAGWQNGGTVKPPWLFQRRNTMNPLNKGSPSDFPHGLRARAGAGTRTSSREQLEPNWSL